MKLQLGALHVAEGIEMSTISTQRPPGQRKWETNNQGPDPGHGVSLSRMNLLKIHPESCSEQRSSARTQGSKLRKCDNHISECWIRENVQTDSAGSSGSHDYSQQDKTGSLESQLGVEKQKMQWVSKCTGFGTKLCTVKSWLLPAKDKWLNLSALQPSFRVNSSAWSLGSCKD